jgi:hypothetical protein
MGPTITMATTFTGLAPDYSILTPYSYASEGDWVGFLGGNTIYDAMW